MSRFRLVLPTIPPPADGTASVITTDGNFKGPIFRGAGDTDLLCGGCGHVLAESLGAGQIENLVLHCPACRKHNAVINIPRLEQVVAQLQNTGIPVAQFPAFKQVLEHAIKSGSSVEQIEHQVHELAPAFSWFNKLLLPTNPGELYGFLSFVIALLVWWQNRKPQKVAPSIVVNNFFSAKDPYNKTRVNEPCPCGSGKKFKKCHGKRE